MISCRQSDFTLDELMPLIRERIAAGQSVWLSPRGVSMLPMLRQDRDTVRLSPITSELKKYDLPIYQRENGQYVLHRIVKAGDTYTCVGDNQFELEEGLKPQQMIAVVTVFRRDGKEYTVHSPGYWIYCRFWHFSRPVRRLWRKVISYLRRLIK